MRHGRGQNDRGTATVLLDGHGTARSCEEVQRSSQNSWPARSTSSPCPARLRCSEQRWQLAEPDPADALVQPILRARSSRAVSDDMASRRGCWMIVSIAVLPWARSRPPPSSLALSWVTEPASSLLPPTSRSCRVLLCRRYRIAGSDLFTAGPIYILPGRFPTMAPDVGNAFSWSPSLFILY